nr:hypothetical protein [Tanacetum cinerariifolium]
RSSGVNVSTPSRFMMKLEKSIGVSRRSLKEERESACFARSLIQDAEKFEQSVDLLHLFQTPNVGVRPSDSSISVRSAATAYEVLDEWDDRVRTSASTGMVLFQSRSGVGVSTAEKTIQDAERIEQEVDLLHLFQTPDVRVLQSEK